MSVAIVWFRRDLRLLDNPALTVAAREHDRVLPVYIHAPDEEGEAAPGAASRWWLHHSLQALDAALRERHGALHVCHGESLRQLRDLARKTGAMSVYWNRLYAPAIIKRDTEIKQALRDLDVRAHSFEGALWRSPWQIRTQQETPYRVFTPFWRNLRAQLGAEAPLPVPQPLSLCTLDDGCSVESLALLPQRDWADGFTDHWTPGERGARELLQIFADDAASGYAQLRDQPARHGTSRISPHLHFGEVTPRSIVATLRRMLQAEGRTAPDLDAYMRELGWREFAHHLLYHFPQTVHSNLNPRFNDFSWKRDKASLQRWQRGHTGIPIVDAGMRELWATGWMHNRVRMIAGSFLTKNLRHHWLDGARWFRDTLVDADLANNTLGWQWIAGSGADAAPYFRIFNPVTQAKRFDSDGEYIRRWIPELGDVAAPDLFAPWEHEGLLEKTGYPAPIVDLKTSRQQALDAYSATSND